MMMSYEVYIWIDYNFGFGGGRRRGVFDASGIRDGGIAGGEINGG